MGYELKKIKGQRPSTSDAPKIATGKQGDSTPLGEKNPNVKKKDKGEASLY